MSIRDPVPGSQVFAPDIFRGRHKPSSCNADHRSAENEKSQSRYLAEFMARQRQSATCSGLSGILQE
jgi:hypothetical protein